MHAIKGGWVGQTFALAKSNESEGRKSRIRRSKKERKAMVESFIKKYQKLNNGSFPSLNLTHKEVGGSFYTVREIVRDIIQENRVLGPAKLTQEKQSTHQLEQEPLGSIALEPQYISTVTSNGFQFVTNEYQSTEEPSLVSDAHQTPEHQIFGNGKAINGTQVDTEEKGCVEVKDVEIVEVVDLEQNVDGDKLDEDKDVVYDSPVPLNGSLVDMRTKESHEVKNEESHELTHKELQLNEASESESVGEESTGTRSKVTPIAGDLELETFPMRPVTRTNDLDGRSSEVEDMANTFSERGTEKVELGLGSSELDGVNSSHDEKVSNQPLDKHSGLVHEEVVEEQLNSLLGSSNCYREGPGCEIQDLTDAKIKVPSTDLTSTSEQSAAIAGAKVVDSPIDVKTKYISHNNGTIRQSKTEEVLTEKESDIQLSGEPQKESNPTLDRINLESWDGASKKSEPQGNPLWAVVKALVSAFVKFWAE